MQKGSYGFLRSLKCWSEFRDSQTVIQRSTVSKKQTIPTDQPTKETKTNQRSLKCHYSIIFDLLQFLPTMKCHILLLHSNFIWLAFTKCQFYIGAMAVWCGVVCEVKTLQETWKPRKHQTVTILQDRPV